MEGVKMIIPTQAASGIEEGELAIARSDRDEWTGLWFVNVGVTKDKDRSWVDSRMYGFISGGQGPQWRDFMCKLKVGYRIFGYHKGLGYVGYGEVTQEALMARDFRIGDGSALLEHKLIGTALRHNVDDPEFADYVVGVDWKQSVVDARDAYKYHGIFVARPVVCKMRDRDTVNYLNDKFNVSGYRP